MDIEKFMSTAQKQRDLFEEDEEENMSFSHIPIEELKKEGLSQCDIAKLIDSGYHTVEAVAYTPKKNLLLIKYSGCLNKIKKYEKISYIWPCAGVRAGLL